ncbi:long-chain-alcohol oxidase FAO4A [Selaginella moellendorffii]|uniref:long-chain-alcohol oxidase FAO4A n=1 Tax=Selaginella moellendorffii TaxID=88036 RepID=UPI000D1CFE9A|nr:long-chain-alcohol oxidase FAO4A [Selaginella moellendorffii]|eukprot:XP_024543429.1 long-chain-alcohol oxidase FAO4A [Selaginella moellendorffii]
MAPPAASLDGLPTSTLAHPLLQGGRPPYAHKFSKAQLEALEALCSTFVPPVSSPDGSHREFYELSGEADAEMVAGRMTQFIHPKLLRRAEEVLGMLSTPKSTPQYPYDKKFSEVPLEEREKLMYQWANSDDDDSRLNFKIFKTFILNTFYSKVDASGYNPTWEAIGYAGPDPNSMKATLPPKPSALKSAVFDVREHPDLRAVLKHTGYTLLDDISHLKPALLPSNKLEDGEDVIGIKCDVIIVGAGSGGSVPAQVLSTAGLKVLLLEKGRYFAREDLSLLEQPTFSELYEEGGFLATDDFAYSLMSAAVVGGGTCINWAASFQTPPHVRQEWAEECGLPMFTSEKYQQALDLICKKIGVQPNATVESFQNAVLRKGCVELGLHSANIPRNASPEHYCGCCNMGCRRGMKQATTETWLVEAAAAGATILTGTKGLQVLFTDGTKKEKKAIGVLATTLGDQPKKLIIEAKATIVSTGSIMTPPLLIRSGLTNPNIGKHFHIHPVLGVWGYFPDEEKNPGASFEGGIMTAFSAVSARWDTVGYGPVLMTPSFHPGQYASVVTWKSGAQHKEAMRRFRRVSQVVLFTRDKGAGSIGVDKKTDEITIEYTLDPYDEEVCLEGAEKGLRVLKAAGAVEVGTHHHDAESFTFGKSTSWKEEKKRFEEYLASVRSKGLKPNRLPMVSYHLLGSCRMGSSPENSVIDAKGETWDAEGLFLTDASVFPTPTGLNPMVTIQSIAYCTAQNIVEHVKSSK